MPRIRWDTVLKTPIGTGAPKPSPAPVENPFNDDATRERVASGVMLSLLVLSVISGLMATAAIGELLMLQMYWPAWVAYPLAAVGLLISRGLIAPLAAWGAMEAWSWPVWVAVLVFMWPVLLQLVVWLGGWTAWLASAKPPARPIPEAVAEVVVPVLAQNNVDGSLPDVRDLGPAARSLIDKIDQAERALIAGRQIDALRVLYLTQYQRSDESFFQDDVPGDEAEKIRAMMLHRLSVLTATPSPKAPENVVPAEDPSEAAAPKTGGLGINGWVASVFGAQLLAEIVGAATYMNVDRTDPLDIGMAVTVGFGAFIVAFIALAIVRKKMEQSVRWGIAMIAIGGAVAMGPQGIGGIFWPVLVQIICWLMGKDRT